MLSSLSSSHEGVPGSSSHVNSLFLSPPPPPPHRPRSSSPLNPLRSSSPPHPLSSPTPGAPSRLPLTFSAASAFSASSSSPSRPSSGTTPKPLSSRYARGSSARGSPRPTAPRVASSSSSMISSDLFTHGNTPTQAAMLREKLARRMAERAEKKKRRDTALTRFRGMSGFDMEDEDERERQAQADDEEMFRRLMVMQRRREQHAALVSHEYETGGSDPALPDFWEEEQDDLAREERALIRQFEGMEGHGYDDEEEMWALEAAAAEEAEAAAEAAEVACAERVERERMAVSDAEWAAVAAMQDDDEMDIG